MDIASPRFRPVRLFALPLAFLLFTLPAAQGAPLPLTTIDFSGGTDDWNPGQTSGKFQRTDSGKTTKASQVRIETDGSDAYLRTGYAPVLFYDTDPATPDFTLLSVGAGESLRLSVDFFYFSETSTGGLRFGVYNPDSSGTAHKGVGAAILFNDATSSYSMSWSFLDNTAGGISSVNLAGFTGTGAIDGGLSASTRYRLELIYTNQETGGAFVYNLYSLAGSEPALIQSSTGTLAYGTGSNDIDLDPDALALAFRFNNLNDDGSAISEVRFEVIPEPSVAGLIGAAALGLAALKVKGKSK
ncbi:MAG TPA: hypothetical protein VNQ90_09385 [Chthoniobacteraceae bacterium]|nr:hypothetical protein [Chthoniobacteraceae bacterium]